MLVEFMVTNQLSISWALFSEINKCKSLSERLVDFYGIEQAVKFEDGEGVSKPDIDPEDTKAEWKLFRRLYLCATPE